MFLTDQATATSTLPTPAAAGTPGYFTNGNPASGVAATIVDADWLNMLQLELLNIVTAAGIVPSKTTYNQALAAIKRLGQSTVVLADTGAVNAYAAVNAVPLVAGSSPTWVDGVVQAVKIAHTNTGASTYAPDGLTAIPIYGLGLQPLQGGELLLNGTAILMHATIAGVNSGNPICVLMECAGGAQQVAPATASQHAVQFGQVSGVVGQVRNLRASAVAGATTAQFTADELIVETALGGLRYCIPNFNATINLAIAGVINGMLSGTAAANGFLGVYAAYSPTTGTSGVFGVMESSAALPSIAASTISGYTATALLTVIPINTTAGQFADFVVSDRLTRYINSTILSGTSTSTTQTYVSNVVTTVPYSARRIYPRANITPSSTSVNGNVWFASAISGVGGGPTRAYGASVTVPPEPIELITPRTLYFASSVSAGSATYSIGCSQYEI
jgi:hypothetical protein